MFFGGLDHGEIRISRLLKIPRLLKNVKASFPSAIKCVLLIFFLLMMRSCLWPRSSLAWSSAP
jgi:hypothetical protein